MSRFENNFRAQTNQLKLSSEDHKVYGELKLGGASPLTSLPIVKPNPILTLVGRGVLPGNIAGGAVYGFDYVVDGLGLNLETGRVVSRRGETLTGRNAFSREDAAWVKFEHESGATISFSISDWRKILNTLPTITADNGQLNGVQLYYWSRDSGTDTKTWRDGYWQ